MEVRHYDGCLVVGGQETEAFTLKVILSTGGGSGSFLVPLALVGAAEDGIVTFRTVEGDEIALRIREIDPAEGYAYFLTEGAVPERPAVARRGSA